MAPTGDVEGLVANHLHSLKVEKVEELLGTKPNDEGAGMWVTFEQQEDDAYNLSEGWTWAGTALMRYGSDALVV